MIRKKTVLFCLSLSVMLFITACNNNEPTKPAEEKPKDSPVVEKEKPPVVETRRAPIINIMDTLSVKRIVLTIKDSAATTERITLKLGEIYGIKLGDFIKKNNLTITGAPMAWYKSQKAPFFFEAGIPVNKRPSKLSSGIQVKEVTGNDSVIVAHFYGPYDLTSQGYDAVEDMLKDRKKKLKSAPYEIYVDDPVDSTGRPKDPYRVQTDIVFPWK